jgi:acyl phosphate:glycerol-3-phosphate acyltransferase
MTALALILSYLVGSIPFGVLAGKLCGVDIRAVGSGNIGATNVMRALGPRVGATVFALDVLKGVAGPNIARLLVGHEAYGTIALCGLAVAVGHVFSVFLKFKGGKAIATGLGVYAALSLPVAVACLSFWGVVLLASRMVSVASMAACVATPIACWYFKVQPPLFAVMSLIALVAFLKHLPNLKRIFDGTEPKIGKKNSSDAVSVASAK